MAQYKQINLNLAQTQIFSKLSNLTQTNSHTFPFYNSKHLYSFSFSIFSLELNDISNNYSHMRVKGKIIIQYNYNHKSTLQT